MRTFNEIAESIGDYAAVNQELIELANNDYIVDRIRRFADQAEWDTIRALKTALVLMAAQRDAIILAHQEPPQTITMFCPHCPHHPKSLG